MIGWMRLQTGVTCEGDDPLGVAALQQRDHRLFGVARLGVLLGGDVEYIPKRPGEPECTFADITKIKTLLNWSPNIKFEDGVEIMLENIEYWGEAPIWDSSSIEAATKEWFELLK